MANSGNGIVLGLGALAAGYAAYKAGLFNSILNPAPPAPAPSNKPLPPYIIPSDLLGSMQNAWTSKGKATDLVSWVGYMSSLVPVSNAAWASVYTQWYGIYSTTGLWPSNSQLHSWLDTGIANNG